MKNYYTDKETAEREIIYIYGLKEEIKEEAKEYKRENGRTVFIKKNINADGSVVYDCTTHHINDNENQKRVFIVRNKYNNYSQPNYSQTTEKDNKNKITEQNISGAINTFKDKINSVESPLEQQKSQQEVKIAKEEFKKIILEIFENKDNSVYQSKNTDANQHDYSIIKKRKFGTDHGAISITITQKIATFLKWKHYRDYDIIFFPLYDIINNKTELTSIQGVFPKKENKCNKLNFNGHSGLFQFTSEEQRQIFDKIIKKEQSRDSTLIVIAEGIATLIALEEQIRKEIKKKQFKSYKKVIFISCCGFNNFRKATLKLKALGFNHIWHAPDSETDDETTLEKIVPSYFEKILLGKIEKQVQTEFNFSYSMLFEIIEAVILPTNPKKTKDFHDSKGQYDLFRLPHIKIKKIEYEVIKIINQIERNNKDNKTINNKQLINELGNYLTDNEKFLYGINFQLYIKIRDILKDTEEYAWIISYLDKIKTKKFETNENYTLITYKEIKKTLLTSETGLGILENRILFVTLPTGSGKTQKYITPLIEKYKHPSDKALIITPTIALAENASTIYKAAFYKDTDSVKTSTKATCCINSIISDSFKHIIHSYKYIIIEEWTQNIQAITGDALDNKELVIDTLFNLICTTDKTVIILDASFEPSELEFFRKRMYEWIDGYKNEAVSLQRKRREYYVTKESIEISKEIKDILIMQDEDVEIKKQITEYNKMEKKPQCLISDNRKEILNSLLLSLTNGEQVFVACDNKNKAKEIHREIYNKHKNGEIKYKPLLLHADNMGEKNSQSFLEAISKKKQPDNYSAVIYTPVISSGVSFELRDFKKTFFFYDTIVPPTSAEQMIARNRLATQIFIYHPPNYNKYRTRLDEIDIMMQQIYLDDTNYTDTFEGQKIYRATPALDIRRDAILSHYKSNIQAKKKYNKDNYETSLNDLLCQKYGVENVSASYGIEREKDRDSDTLQSLNNTGKEIKEEEVEQILKAENISEYHYNVLTYNKRTQKDSYKKEKYEIMQWASIKKEQLTKDIIKLWANKTQRRALDIMEILEKGIGETFHQELNTKINGHTQKNQHKLRIIHDLLVTPFLEKELKRGDFANIILGIYIYRNMLEGLYLGDYQINGEIRMEASYLKSIIKELKTSRNHELKSIILQKIMNEHKKIRINKDKEKTTLKYAKTVKSFVQKFGYTLEVISRKDTGTDARTYMIKKDTTLEQLLEFRKQNRKNNHEHIEVHSQVFSVRDVRDETTKTHQEYIREIEEDSIDEEQLEVRRYFTETGPSFATASKFSENRDQSYQPINKYSASEKRYGL